MCPDCYDYEAAVLFNAYAEGPLAAVHYLPAALPGPPRWGYRQRAARRPPRPVRQGGRIPGPWRRPLHAVIRLDAPGEDYQPPPARYTADLLCNAIGRAAAAVRVPADAGQIRPVLLGFGAQTDTRPIRRDAIAGTGQPLDGQAVANYIAKYATKTLAAPGLSDARIRHAIEITGLRCSAHYRQMIITAWQLGGKRQTGDPRFRQ